MRIVMPSPSHAPKHVHMFFFQAEGGIRDHCVTGVQTCALPISRPSSRIRAKPSAYARRNTSRSASTAGSRSEERRVGKEYRSRSWAGNKIYNREESISDKCFCGQQHLAYAKGFMRREE